MTADLAPGVFVLGMHRSGTSAVTHVVEQLGLFAGDPGDLKRESWQNPQGFFERHDVRLVANALLESAKADWWRVRSFHHDRIDADVLDYCLAEIRTILARLSEGGRWVLKEPRLCLLLPVFLQVAKQPLAVFVYRNPIEVARSLRRRDGIPTVAGLALWERYNTAGLQASAGIDRIMVNYGQLVEHPATSARALANAIAAWSGPVPGDPDKAASVIDPALRREATDDKAMATLLSTEQRTLWEALIADAVGDPPKLSPRSSEILREFERDEASRRALTARLETRETELTRLRQETKEERAKAREARRQLKEAKAISIATTDQAGQPSESPAKSSGEAASPSEEHEANIAELRSQLDTAVSDGQTARERASALATRIATLERRLNVIGDLAEATSARRQPDRIGPIRRLLGGRRRTTDDRMVVSSEHPGVAIGRSAPAIGKPVVLTASISGNDPPNPSIIDVRADYIAVSDEAIIEPIWERQRPDYFDPDPARAVAFIKTHPHAYCDGDWVVWIDPGLRLSVLPGEFIGAIDGDEVPNLVVVDSNGSTLFGDLEASAENADPEPNARLRAEVDRYRAAGIAVDAKTYAAELFALHLQSPTAAAFLADWWRLIEAGAGSDGRAFSAAIALNPALHLRTIKAPGAAVAP